MVCSKILTPTLPTHLSTTSLTTFWYRQTSPPSSLPTLEGERFVVRCSFIVFHLHYRPAIKSSQDLSYPSSQCLLRDRSRQRPHALPRVALLPPTRGHTRTRVRQECRPVERVGHPRRAFHGLGIVSRPVQQRDARELRRNAHCSRMGTSFLRCRVPSTYTVRKNPFPARRR